MISLTRCIVIISFLLCSISSFSQEVIFTIDANYNNSSISLDSILIENISNGSRVLFSALPEQEEYIIKLSGQGSGPTGILDFIPEDAFGILENSPGILNIAFTRNQTGFASLSVYNIQGQLVHAKSSIIIKAGIVLKLNIGKPGVFIVKIDSPDKPATFKAIGISKGGIIYSDISEISIQNETGLKSFSSQNDFFFNQGDSIRISCYRENLYAPPREIEIESSEGIHFIFNESNFENTGISDAYVFLDDEIQSRLHYNPLTGSVTIENSTQDPGIFPGSIISIDLDSTGVLRRVNSMEYRDNNMIYFETSQAYLNELFTEIALKLDTEFKKSDLWPDSEQNLIIESLTDENGYLHPEEIIFVNEHGEITKKTALSINNESLSIVPVIDYVHEFSNTNLIGDQNEAVHLYLKSGTATIKSNARFEMEFKYEGERDSRTKARLGKVKKFNYFLDPEVNFYTSIYLDLKNLANITGVKSLYDFQKVCTKFIVAPGVPIWISLDADVFGKFQIHADSSLNANWNLDSKNIIKTGASYDQESQSFTPMNESAPKYTTFPLNLQGKVNASTKLELYPKIDINFYNTPGPFAEIKPFTEGIYNSTKHELLTPVGSENFVSWNSSINIGLDLKVGADLRFLDNENRNYLPEIIKVSKRSIWKSPVKIVMTNNLPSELISGSLYEIRFKVTDLIGLPVFNCPVYIEGDGEFNRYISLTNAEGEVSFNWNIRNVKDIFTFKAGIYDDEQYETETIEKFIPVKLCFGCETDIFEDPRDGKQYKTVVIGEQTWIAENMAYLPYVTDASLISTTEPYHYIYNYRGTEVNEGTLTDEYRNFGVLYNWPAAINACPEGWHLPTDNDWKKLELFLGLPVAQLDRYGWRGINTGDRIKATGTDLWYSPNDRASDMAGFSAIPGGYFSEGSHFTYKGSFGKWWTSTEDDPDDKIAYYRVLHFNSSQIFRGENFMEHGYSVRCVKD